MRTLAGMERPIVLGCVLGCLLGCGMPPADVTPEPPFASARGFIDVDGHHLFYVLLSADDDPSAKPLFVYFNGGPGFPTSQGLLVEGTAPMRLDDLDRVVENPASFTALGSALYLDQRLTGFSYDDAPAVDTSFDMTGDAVDHVLAILGVLEQHPEVRDRPIVIVGESYGGARAQLVLDMLLHYQQVPTIRDAMQRHVDAVMPGARLPAEISEQFFAQVLIQPVVLGARQVELSTPPDGSCGYDVRSTGRCGAADALPALVDPVAGTALLGGPLEAVPELAGPERHGARIGECAKEEPQLVARLGALDPQDCYLAYGAISSAWSTDTTLVPSAFERNLAHVDTLITNAVFDGIVDTPAIARALGATVSTWTPAGAARPGEILATLPTSGPVRIRFPTYDAGHMVTRTSAAELRADIEAWLADPRR